MIQIHPFQGDSNDLPMIYFYLTRIMFKFTCACIARHDKVFDHFKHPWPVELVEFLIGLLYPSMASMCLFTEFIDQ